MVRVSSVHLPEEILHPKTFNCVVPAIQDYPFAHLVHPLKQRYVKPLIDYAESNSLVKRMWLFGSSITWRCWSESDTDVAIEHTRELSREENADMYYELGTLVRDINIFDLSSGKWEGRLVSDAKKGVLLYENLSR